MKALTLEQLENKYLNSKVSLYWLDRFSPKSCDEHLNEIMSLIVSNSSNSTLSELATVSYEEEGMYLNREERMTLRALYSLAVDKDAVIARPDNLLTEPDITAGWRPKFEHEAAKYIIKTGVPINDKTSLYNWTGSFPDGTTVLAAFNLHEDEWAEFGGTFGGDNSTHFGFSVEVLLSDGQFMEVRKETSISEFMRELG